MSELYQLTALIDGAELYSRICEQDHAEEYIRIVHKKAENIFFTKTHELLHLV